MFLGSLFLFLLPDVDQLSSPELLLVWQRVQDVHSALVGLSCQQDPVAVGADWHEQPLEARQHDLFKRSPYTKSG